MSIDQLSIDWAAAPQKAIFPGKSVHSHHVTKTACRLKLDVVRMLALGAKGVLLGRAWVYALAARGEAGVSHLLDLIAREMRVAMTLTGAHRIADINRNSLAPD